MGRIVDKDRNTANAFLVPRLEPIGGGLGPLLRAKLRILWHRIRDDFLRMPLHLVGVVGVLAVVWGGLFLLFNNLFAFIERGPNRLVIPVAMGYVLNYFFAALILMFILSAGIILYGMLFRGEEIAFLMSNPLPCWQAVLVKYMEAVFLAGWAFVLLGVPLMAAYGWRQDAPWTFYPMFAAFFVAFIPIPSAIGAAAALLIAWLFGRRALRATVGILVLLGGVGGLILYYVFDPGRIFSPESTNWIDELFSELDMIRGPLMPNYWLSRGILAASAGRMRESLFWLAQTVSAGLFFSLTAVRFCGWLLPHARSRGRSAGREARRRASWPDRVRSVLGFLPRPVQLVIVKDLQTFVRDPLQWMQFILFFGLLFVCVLNMPNLAHSFSSPAWRQSLSFLTLMTVSLILTTFTGRFIFPLVSLEGQTLWLLGMTPVDRKVIIYSKFLFAAVLTSTAAIFLIGLSDVMLGLPTALRLVHLAQTLVITSGLAGISVGLGARMPSFRQNNPARIAAGLGGTINLMVSLGYVAACLGLFGVLTFSSHVRSFLIAPWSATLVVLLLAGILALGALGTWIPLRIGIRHFRKAEF